MKLFFIVSIIYLICFFWKFSTSVHLRRFQCSIHVRRNAEPRNLRLFSEVEVQWESSSYATNEHTFRRHLTKCRFYILYILFGFVCVSNMYIKIFFFIKVPFVTKKYFFCYTSVPFQNLKIATLQVLLILNEESSLAMCAISNWV